MQEEHSFLHFSIALRKLSPQRDGTKCQDWEHKNVFLNHILIFVVIQKKMTYLKKWYHYLLKILSIWLLQHEYFLWNLKYDNFQYEYYFSFDERRIFEIFGLTNFDRYNVGFFHGCILFYGKENKNIKFHRGNCSYARRKLRDFI